MEGGTGNPDHRQNVENNNTDNTNGIDEPQEPPTREITQTDHLNKRLLNSFLEKINESSGFPVVSRIDTDAEPEVDEWTPTPDEKNAKQAVTNGGKTALSARLKQQLPNVHILNMDCYYWPEDSPHHIMLPQFNYANWEVPSSVDFVRLLADTEKWVETVQNQSPGGQHILLIEGILIYNYRPLLQYFNKKYAFTLSLQECRKRRRQRRYVPPDPDGYFDAIVWPHYLENSTQIAQQNDIVYLDGSVDTDITFQQVLRDIKLLFKQ